MTQHAVNIPTELCDKGLDSLIKSHLEAIDTNSSDIQITGFSAVVDVMLGENAGDPDAEITAMFGLLIAAVHRICILSGYIEWKDD